MMRPAMDSGQWRRNRMARPNISSGPITQFCNSERPRIFLFRKTSPNSSYRTFAKGGYIIRMRPTAIGMEVVPALKRFRKGTTPGSAQPAATPTSMAVKIHTVRYRSKKLRRLVVFIRRPLPLPPSAMRVWFLKLWTLPRGSLPSDVVNFFLQRETIQSRKRQTQEQTDSSIQEKARIAKSSFHLLLWTPHGRRIGHAPVRGHWLARPYRAHLVGRVVTDRKNKIELRGIRPGEFIPGLTPETAGWQVSRFQL